MANSKCCGFSHNIPWLMSAPKRSTTSLVNRWRYAWDAYSFTRLLHQIIDTCIVLGSTKSMSSALVQLIPGSLITCMLFKLKSRPYLSYTIRTIHCDAQFPTQNHKKINNHAPGIVACQDLMKISLGHHHVYYCGFISQPYILNNKICHFSSWASHNFKWDS